MKVTWCLKFKEVVTQTTMENESHLGSHDLSKQLYERSGSWKFPSTYQDN